jgi:hypothetical protein
MASPEKHSGADSQIFEKSAETTSTIAGKPAPQLFALDMQLEGAEHVGDVLLLILLVNSATDATMHLSTSGWVQLLCSHIIPLVPFKHLHSNSSEGGMKAGSIFGTPRARQTPLF